MKDQSKLQVGSLSALCEVSNSKLTPGLGCPLSASNNITRVEETIQLWWDSKWSLLVTKAPLLGNDTLKREHLCLVKGENKSSHERLEKMERTCDVFPWSSNFSGPDHAHWRLRVFLRQFLSGNMVAMYGRTWWGQENTGSKTHRDENGYLD